MSPGHMNITLVRGVPWHKKLTIMHPQWQYRAISQIHVTAPLTITAPSHGLPGDSWPVWIEGSTSSQLNSDKSRQRFRIAKVLDADTLEFNDINGSGLTAAGGQIVYQMPVDFTGCSARMEFDGLTLTDGSGLTLGDGEITIDLTTQQVVDLEHGGRYKLIVTHTDGKDVPWLCGEVTTHDCRKPC